MTLSRYTVYSVGKWPPERWYCTGPLVALTSLDRIVDCWRIGSLPWVFVVPTCAGEVPLCVVLSQLDQQQSHLHLPKLEDSGNFQYLQLSLGDGICTSHPTVDREMKQPKRCSKRSSTGSSFQYVGVKWKGMCFYFILFKNYIMAFDKHNIMFFVSGLASTWISVFHLRTTRDMHDETWRSSRVSNLFLFTLSLIDCCALRDQLPVRWNAIASVASLQLLYGAAIRCSINKKVMICSNTPIIQRIFTLGHLAKGCPASWCPWR
jgi:hypothetical protein